MKKNLFVLFLLTAFTFIGFSSCKSVKSSDDTVAISSEEQDLFNKTEGDTITIANEETEYEIIIIEPGYNSWLQSMARQKGFYSQSYLENRNRIYVMEWNSRVLQPLRYRPDLYELQINYDYNTDYGYEVNYKLYNYFIYFQRKYRQRLGPFVPRI